ncbi:excalibur calcium-binding domain-containing protein [Streptococcus dysgalactiae]|uniref:excalibur calcium-binding domain-containing protein n=1 Tax=Streptococcus dysgalactiae TaxID=1334 RepID=UPI001CF4145B|nr:excalibur calcium-binding domain-containing protein [Streptococcus dysgalactiae]MCB2832620.1 excalibur calcium-binding domain-containing protein [Streptococcus dysgalactiae subsp. dysgalactiae]MCB2840394.1 excalibur calcium-binding domain-containing protein [Streptococcus dysgalactiae subsp. dysgalactiae]MCB2844215.1 excalibur calcium-binding domain-containing protein [Streptococcus dysgalactiae subsp. dysgalactiae]
MKHKGCLAIILYFILGIIVLSILLMLMPFILVAGIIGLWFYTKKRPDNKRRNYAITAIVVGSIGTLILGSGLTNTSDKGKVTTQITPKTAISKASQKPEKQSKKQISQNENRKVQTAQRALITLEKDTNRTNLEKAREAIGQVKHSKDKESLQRQFNILEQAIYFTEAEATIKELEIKKTKHLIESAKQKVNLVSNTNKRNALRNRIDSVTKAIEDQEVQQAAANNAEIAIQQLENNQIRDNIGSAQAKVNLLSDVDKKTAFTNRINAVVSAIETREAQEREAQAAAATQQQFAQTPRTYYANCTEMRSAGAAPIQQGQPGYATHLDRDHDGWACE